MTAYTLRNRGNLEFNGIVMDALVPARRLTTDEYRAFARRVAEYLGHNTLSQKEADRVIRNGKISWLNGVLCDLLKGRASDFKSPPITMTDHPAMIMRLHGGETMTSDTHVFCRAILSLITLSASDDFNFSIGEENYRSADIKDSIRRFYLAEPDAVANDPHTAIALDIIQCQGRQYLKPCLG